MQGDISPKLLPSLWCSSQWHREQGSPGPPEETKGILYLSDVRLGGAGMVEADDTSCYYLDVYDVCIINIVRIIIINNKIQITSN